MSRATACEGELHGKISKVYWGYQFFDLFIEFVPKSQDFGIS
jgi:hypothetical protein